jgi:hypothetical protein
VKQVDRELVLLRETWSDSIPDVNIRFTPPWVFDGISVLVDTSLYIEIMAGSNSDWNQIRADLNLEVSEPLQKWFPRYLSLHPATPMHPIRLAESFIGFPGVAYIRAGDRIQDWDDWFVRVPSTKGAKYYFKHCTCPDLYNAYAYFEVDEDTARFVGIHYECWDSIVVYPTWVSYERFEEIVDSLEANREPWVDTVRSAVRDFTDNSEFVWSRRQ